MNMPSISTNVTPPAQGALHNQPGINSGIWSNESLSERHFELAGAAGFKAMELSRFRYKHHVGFLDVHNPDQIRRLQKASRDTGVAAWSIHSDDAGDITSPDPAERQKQIDELRWCLDAADALGARIVVSHMQVLGKHFQEPSGVARADEVMNELLPRAQASCARLALENGYVCKDGQWTRDIFARVNSYPSDAFGYVIDTGHINCAGDWDDVEKGIGRRLISLHLNDNAGTDIHLTGGKGTVDWAWVARMLKASRYDGCLMWEIGVGGKDFDPQLLIDTMHGHRILMAELGKV